MTRRFMFLGGGGAVGLGEGRVKLISTLAVRNGEKSDGARYDKSLGFWVRFFRPGNLPLERQKERERTWMTKHKRRQKELYKSRKERRGSTSAL